MITIKAWILLLGLCSTSLAMLTKPIECGDTKGCYSDCSNGDNDCLFVVTWVENGDNVDFELSLAPTGSGNKWIALGLSSDNSMGADSVTDCIMTGGSGAVITKSYNEGRSNAVMTDSQEFGLTNTFAGFANGVLKCSYSQSKASTNNKIFNLNMEYTLLVANGDASAGSKLQHPVGNELPQISPEMANFQSTTDLSGTAVNTLVKVHGCLMIYAWVWCASIGIVLARFFKKLWPNSKVLSEKPWFTFHRMCMISCFLICIAGFVVIFVETKEWSKLEGSSMWQRAHPYLGVIITFFVILNPIMALVRPHPDDKNRPLFNWAHWFVGTAAQILAVMALILGVTLAKAATPFYCVWILVAWAVYQVCVEIFLEIHDCFGAGQETKYHRDGALKEPEGSFLKKCMLGVHVVIITGFTIACVVVVAYGK